MVYTILIEEVRKKERTKEASPSGNHPLHWTHTDSHSSEYSCLKLKTTVNMKIDIISRLTSCSQFPVTNSETTQIKNSHVRSSVNTSFRIRKQIDFTISRILMSPPLKFNSFSRHQTWKALKVVTFNQKPAYVASAWLFPFLFAASLKACFSLARRGRQ